MHHGHLVRTLCQAYTIECPPDCGITTLHLNTAHRPIRSIFGTFCNDSVRARDPVTSGRQCVRVRSEVSIVPALITLQGAAGGAHVSIKCGTLLQEIAGFRSKVRPGAGSKPHDAKSLQRACASPHSMGSETLRTAVQQPLLSSETKFKSGPCTSCDHR